MNRLMIIAILSLFFAACESGESNIDRTAVPPVPEETPVSQYFGDRTWYEYSAHTGVLIALITTSSETLLTDRTIGPPEGVVKKLESVPSAVREDFETINRRSVKLDKQYDVHATLTIVSAKSNVPETLEFARKKYPKADAVIYLSRVGLSPTADTHLVYYERYKFDGTVTKGFCLFSPNGDQSWFDGDGKPF